MAHESCNLDKEEAEMLKPSPSPSSPSPLSAPQSPSSTPPPPISVKPQKETPSPTRPPLEPPPSRAGNRCSSCEKRVRLAGFRCRCGELFCSRHRHSDTHDCSFDYKAAGREEIGKANPMIRAAKIIKI